MTTTTPKPAQVPAEATWSDEDSEWVVCQRDDAGRLHGEARYWRPDGSYACRCEWDAGLTHGPLERWHPNGERSQTATYVRGEFHGTRTWFATDTETTEHFRAPGIHETVWRSEMDYEHGQVVHIRHFDREGHRVLPENGEPYPAQPEGVPAEADYYVTEKYWALGRADGDQEKQGLWRYWGASGAPQRDVEYRDDVKNGAVRLYEEGVVVSERTYVAGRCEGPARFRAVLGYPAHGGSWLVGRLEGGVAVGRWELRDDAGLTVGAVDIGLLPESSKPSPVFDDRVRTADEWAKLADTLFTERRTFEGLLALARRAATKRDASQLRSALERRTLIASERQAERLAAEVHDDVAIEDEDDEADRALRSLGGRLVLGASPAAVLEAMADRAHENGDERGALDFVDAALLLEPGRPGCLFTRALVLLGAGKVTRAQEDVQALSKIDADAAVFLCDYVRISFPTFDFWASKTTPVTTYSGLPEAPEQPLESVQAVVAKYALRLTQLREALEAKAPDNHWVPELSELVRPDVHLETYSFELADDDGDASSVDVDETLDTDGMSVLVLLETARCDWNALTYLCWSAGLEEVAVPNALVTPKTFGAAAGMSTERLWRARDKRALGGLGAKMSGAPGFEWEGMDIDEMDRRLVGIAESQYAELAALFRWLTDARQKSPWQDNLRSS